jgi:hypothetical protein
MSPGLRSSQTMSTIRRPASVAILICSESTAGIVLAPGSESPSTSISSVAVDAAAAKKGDLRTVFRKNLLFHRTFFSICGNVPLMEVIEQMALKTHAIRSYSIGDPVLLKLVREQHQRMIDLLSTQDRKSPPACCVGTTQGQRHVVALGTGGVGMASRRDASAPGLEGVGCLLDRSQRLL